LAPPGRVACPKRGFVAMSASPAQGIPSIASPIHGAGASEVAEVIDGLERITLAEESAPNLNAEQQRALDLMLEGKNIFVTGVGGTGKSVLLREMRRRLELEGKVVGIAAPTGLAAEAISGSTVHSVAGFGLPKCVNDLGIASQLKTSVIKSYDVLMIDEVSMVNGEFFDRVSEHMSAVRQNGRPFGGMQIVLFGDFLQLGPIDNTKKRGKSGFCPALILNRGYAFESWTWRDLKLQFVELKQVFRQSDQHFAEILRRIRLGIPQAADELLAIIKGAEGNASRRQSLSNGNALRLVATNDKADEINKQQLDKIRNPAYKFKAHDRVELSHDLSNEMATRARIQLEGQGVPKDARIRDLLWLKEGAKVMMLKNMEINDDSGTVKLVNGSRGYVTKMVSAALMLPMLKDRFKKWEEELNKTCQELHRNNITGLEMDKVVKPLQLRNQKLHTQIACIEAQQGDVRIPLVKFQVPDHEKGGTQHTRPLPVLPEEFKFETVGLGANVRVQIPLMHAWAITIHKAQGMTLDSVKVVADKMFADGQAYVAFSRARTPIGLAVEGLTRDKIIASSTCKEFYRVGPENYEATRMWWEDNPSMTDPQAQILEKLIQLKGRNKDKDALAFKVLKQKYVQDETWRCRSCGANLLCCYEVKELVDKTVRVRQRVDTEDERPKQRARAEIEEVADEDLEDLIYGANEDDDEVPEAIMPTQLAPTQTQPADALGE